MRSLSFNAQASNFTNIRLFRNGKYSTYPYQWSNTGDRIKHWCFVLPLDERTTRVFFLFYFEALKIPFVFITGYGADVGLPPAFADTPRLPKPCSSDALQSALKHRLDGSVRD